MHLSFLRESRIVHSLHCVQHCTPCDTRVRQTTKISKEDKASLLPHLVAPNLQPTIDAPYPCVTSACVKEAVEGRTLDRDCLVQDSSCEEDSQYNSGILSVLHRKITFLVLTGSKNLHISGKVTLMLIRTCPCQVASP